MAEFATFFIVLAIGLLLSEIFSKLHLPWVIALIIGGIIIGPSGLNWFTPDPTIEFLSQIGLVFLMFMAGLETRLSSFKEIRRGVEILALLNSLVPFLIGVSIGRFFGYGWESSLLLGAIFISSSIAVVIPSLTVNDLMKTKLGKTVVATTMIEDIASLILLSVLLQTADQTARIPLPLFYLLFLISLLLLRWFVSRIKEILPTGFFFIKRRPKDLFQQELRLVLTILIGTVILFELLGLHPIIAGFFAGLILSESLVHEKLMEKLRVLSYGLFIPIFFVVIGTQTNLGITVATSAALIFTLVVVGGSILSKFGSGLIGGRFSGFNWPQSMLIGSATVPQLTTSLAVVFTGFNLGLFNEELVAAIIMLSLITTLASPFLINMFAKKFSTRTITAERKPI